MKTKNKCATATALSEWESFSSSCLKGLPDIQVSEMKKAFYMGIIASLNITCSIPESYTEKQTSKVFANVFGDAEKFLNSLIPRN